MEWCHWCYIFQPEWNQLVEDFGIWFGKEIIFVTVDAQTNYFICNKYGIYAYPSFVLLDVKENNFEEYKLPGRSYELLKNWILEKTKDKIQPLAG